MVKISRQYRTSRPEGEESSLATVSQAVLGFCLLIVVDPSLPGKTQRREHPGVEEVRMTYSEIGVCISIRKAGDIFICRETIWVATNVNSIGVLVYSNVIDEHIDWEVDVGEVNLSKVLRHAQVCNDVLSKWSASRQRSARLSYHRFLRRGTSANLGGRIVTHTASSYSPSLL